MGTFIAREAKGGKDVARKKHIKEREARIQRHRYSIRDEKLRDRSSRGTDAKQMLVRLSPEGGL
jgi:hypothetical protein